ncbi:flavin reductase [Streptomyces sp. NPDC003015]
METADFTRAMSRVPGPVTVVTTAGADGTAHGFTASSFSSASLDPPLVLVCLDKGASTHAAFTENRHFLVNVLGRGQEHIARRFATSGIERFATARMHPLELGLPGLPDASVRIACTLHGVLDAGDHSVLLGRVEATSTGDLTPLVYVDRSFHHPAHAAPPPTPSPTDPRSHRPMQERAFPLIFADRVTATAEFYERLGFARGRQSPNEGEPTYIALRRGTAELAVVSTDWPETQYGSLAGPGPRFEMFVLVDDLDTTLKELADASVPLLRAPADMPWGERIAYVTDPDGNPVALAAAPHS